MLDILAIIAPIYLAILIGYLMTRSGIFAKATLSALLWVLGNVQLFS
jgi:predicted permease